MSRWTARRRQFRDLLETPKCVYPASVFDPISARVAENLGFEMGMYAGSLASLAVLAAPDLILLTLSEFAEQAHRISRASALPVFADADHGYGNALNVTRTVEELEDAGLVGMSIEDTDLPQPFGTGGKARLLSVEEGVGKMKAAMAGKADPDLVVAGRTSAAQMTSVDDCIARAKAYQAAGVDALMLVGVPDRAALDRIAAEVSIPLLLGGGGKDLRDPEYLAAKGARFLLRGHQTFNAAVQAMHDTMKALREGAEPETVGKIDKDLLATLIRDADYKTRGTDWL